MLDVSYNRIDVLPHDITEIPNLDLNNNPLSSVPAMFREDKSKVNVQKKKKKREVCFNLFVFQLLFYAKYGGKTEPWNQVKLMLVGPEVISLLQKKRK